MIRQNIILGNYTYLIDLYKVNTDIKKVDVRYKSFYFFRKYNLMNDILYDTDIYIIDEDDYSKVKNNEGNIIYPITNKSYVGYSNNIYSFNDDLSIDNLDTNIYNFYSIENNLDIASIPCDVLRIYFPEVHVGLDCILDVENFINSINFHYLIKDISKYKTKLENELKVNNSTYCEYIDIYIPNIESLFSDDILVIDHNGTNLKELYPSADNIYIPFNSLLLPFRIEKPDINSDYSEYSNIKVYEIDKYYSKSSNGFISKNIKYLYSSFNVILYPYQDIDNTGQYILDKNLDYNSDIFSYDKSFELKVELRFPRPDDCAEYIYEEIEEQQEIEIKEKDYEYYKNQPLTFEILEEGEISFTAPTVPQGPYASLFYSLNNREPIQMFHNDVNTYDVGTIIQVYEPNYDKIKVYKNDIILFSSHIGNNWTDYRKREDNYFTSTGKYNISGNILSLSIYGLNLTKPEQNNYSSGYISRFTKLFFNNKIVSAKNLIISNTVKTNGDSSWLYDDAYEYLFENCIELIEAPIIYDSELSYKYIFKGCSKLNKVICLDKNPTIIRYEGWLDGVSPTGTLYKDSSVDDSIFRDIIPEGWTIENYVEEKNSKKITHIIKRIQYNDNFESIEGIPSLIAKFNYPYDDIFDLNTSYLKLNKITFEEYEDITKEEIEDYSEELDLETSINKTGFYIEFASDKDFKNIIYNFNINIDLESGKVIDDLIFPLNEIFNTWSNYLDLITCRVIYVDKVTNNYIYSNPVILTKEWYKYLINEDEKYRLTYLRKNYDTIDSYIEKLNNEEEGMVFLDNVNCSIIVNNESETKNITKKNNPRIIYKPIFYKVGDLQNIRIKEGIKQNIGINLGDILSKVERFKMKINDEEIIESGRNDIYVLFQINSTSFTNSSGKYIIVNQDNEFISDGNWYLY